MFEQNAVAVCATDFYKMWWWWGGGYIKLSAFIHNCKLSSKLDS